MNPADTETRASSSSSSSIYSSPNGTPTTATCPEPEHPQPQQQQQQQNNEPTASSKYEELMIQTKTKMANKFDQLEKDTGLRLEDETVLMVEPNSKTKSSQTTNGCSKINSKVSYGNGHDRLKETEYLFMEKEIKRFKEELNMKNDIINKMCKIRSQVEGELEDLTASLFEEANKMVYDANVLRDRAEKELYEANLKIDMLTAEVQALKLLVITSTPSKPNAHLHPQLMMNTPKAKQRNHHGNNDNSNNNSGSSPTNNKNINRTALPIKSPSNYELGDKSSETSSDRSKHLDGEDDLDDYIYYSNKQESHNNYNSNNNTDLINCVGEIDPVFYEEFNEWRKCPTVEPMNSNFMKRIYDEEIYPVFNFKNKNLTSLVLRAIENNTLTVETVSNNSNNNVYGGDNNNNQQKNKLPFPKKCALLEVARVCRYRMKIEDQQWFYICQLSRNRITTVCDLFCYLRYVQNGLVKSNVKDIYWQIMRRRRNIALSKLGFSPIT